MSLVTKPAIRPRIPFDPISSLTGSSCGYSSDEMLGVCASCSTAIADRYTRQPAISLPKTGEPLGRVRNHAARHRYLPSQESRFSYGRACDHLEAGTVPVQAASRWALARIIPDHAFPLVSW